MSRAPLIQCKGEQMKQILKLVNPIYARQGEWQPHYLHFSLLVPCWGHEVALNIHVSATSVWFSKQLLGTNILYWLLLSHTCRGKLKVPTCISFSGASISFSYGSISTFISFLNYGKDSKNKPSHWTTRQFTLDGRILCMSETLL